MNYNAKWKEEQKRYNRHLNKILLNYDDLIAEWLLLLFQFQSLWKYHSNHS